MIAILKYNAGNTASVVQAVKRLGFEAIVTDSVEELVSADKVIFPGVGEASSAMQYLRDRQLDEVIKSLKQPVLGICLGMQLLCEYTEEGETEGLGIFKTIVRKFPPVGIVPHMGWNDFQTVRGKLFDNIKTSDDCYFVHSYYVPLCQETIAVTEYILPFSAALARNNFYGTQFHPEKSASIGEQLLKNFLEL